jgi:excisionase family DNA binding protein
MAKPRQGGTASSHAHAAHSSLNTQHQPKLEPLLTVSEAAKLLGISPWTLRQWLSQRRLPFVKVGRLTKLRPSDLQAFIAANVCQEVRHG